MEKRIVQFKGMTNVPDDGINEAGDMSVLLNMRHKGGELVQCQPPSEAPTGGDIKKVLYHQYSNQWIVLRNDGSLNMYEDLNSDNPLVVKEEGVESFALMGNVIIMNLENDIEYAIWHPNGLEYLGRLPEVPKMTVDVAIKKVTSPTQSYYGALSTAQANGVEGLWEGYNRKGQMDFCLNTLYESGAYIDLACFVLALRLFDGTYKKISPVYIVNGTTKDTIMGLDNFTWKSTSNVNGPNDYYAEVEGFIPSFKIENYNFKKWEDIVSSVCLFTSGSLPMHKVKRGVPEYMLETLLSKQYDDYLMTPAKEYKEIITDATYYKIAEYDLTGNLKNSLENTSPSSLANEETLSFKTVLDFKGEYQENINNRLHSYNSTAIYPEGFAGMHEYIDEPYIATKRYIKIITKTYIKTQKDETNVVAEEGNADGLIVPNLIIYPSQNAYKMDLYALKEIANNMGHFLCYKSLDFEKSLFSAFYISEDLWKVNDIKIVSSLSYNIKITDESWVIKKFGSGTKTIKYNENGWWGVDGNRIHAGTFFEISGTPAAGDSFQIKITRKEPKTFQEIPREILDDFQPQYNDVTVEWDAIEGTDYGKITDIAVSKGLTTGKDKEANVLRVSELGNPFVFPETQMYKFDGDIVALASNAEAISTGQFGQYPLYVFTTEGIWAMQVDSTGKTAYLNQTPFSREVCCGDVCPVSGGVVFTTERGLMAISGGNVVELSKPLDGLEELLFNSSGMLAGEIFTRAEYDDHTKFEPVPIREYIKGAKLAYNYLHNEVILSNVNYGYSYVYSLDNQTWSMIDKTFDVTTNSYPELKVFNSDKEVMYEFKDGADANKVVAITRPFTLGSFDYKRLRQAALRTTFTGTLNFYLLGSNDGANFVCITGKEYPSKNGGESMNVTRRDLITAMSRSKQYKYFAIAIAGNMKGRVSLAELLVDAGFANNKLR